MATASVPNTFASAVTATGLQLDQNYSTLVAYINDPLNRNNWATDSGTTNTIVLTFSPAVDAYSAGLEITFKAAVTNTGATDINANALGAKNFIQPGGSELAAGQIEADGIYKAAYNGSAFVYIGQNVLAASAGDVATATSAITFVSPATLPAAAATQTDLETATATVGFVTPANSKYQPGVAKAWAVWDGTATGTLTALSSFGVSQITRTGAGTYGVVVSNGFATTAWPVIAIPSTSPSEVRARSITTDSASITVFDSNGAAADSGVMNFVAFGDLP